MTRANHQEFMETIDYRNLRIELKEALPSINMHGHLPDKLSDLIDLALVCLNKAEQNPRYQIDMVTWHEEKVVLSGELKCHICFAGAVIAFALGENPNNFRLPGDYDKDTCNKLRALDSICNGCVYDALRLMDKPTDHTRSGHRIVSYWVNPKAWKHDMKAIVKQLRTIGQ